MLQSLLFAQLLLLSSSVVLPIHRAQASPSNQNRISIQTVEKAGQTQAFVRLANGLEVFMISDPRFQKSSAAMSVGVGSWSDPEDHQGLAHFLEHMLFLGSRDFPGEGEYTRYLRTYGGNYNAYTSNFETNYFFDVQAQAFDGALHRFSGFFVAPLFTPQFVEREKNAVNSEFENSRENEYWRKSQVLGLTAPEGHPARKEMCGNLRSLARVDQKVLVDFYEKHYSANTMKLVLTAPEPIENLVAYAEKYFSAVPNRNLPVEIYRSIPLGVGVGNWVEIKAVQNVNNLEIMFALPRLKPLWRTRANEVLSFLLGHEGTGSLTAALKSTQLITALSAGVSESSSGDQFVMQLSLTEAGAGQVEQILETTFAYIQKIRSEGFKEYTYNEMKMMARLNLENRGLVEGSGRALQYANLMNYYPALEIDERSTQFYDYSPEQLDQLLSLLTPEKMTVVRQYRGATTDFREAIYGVDYSLRSIDAKLIDRLKLASANHSLQYPSPNPYVPTNLTMLSGQSGSNPRLVVDSDFGKLWYAPESSPEIARPKAMMTFKIYSPELARSARQQLTGRMYVFALNRKINEWLYLVNMAGYNLDISVDDASFKIQIFGYSDAIVRVAKDLVSQFAAGLSDSDLRDGEFDLVKEQVTRSLDQIRRGHPYAFAAQELASLINTNRFTIDQMGAELERIQRSDVIRFGSRALERVFVQSLIYGNVSEDSAREVFQHLQTATGGRGVGASEMRNLLTVRRPLESGRQFVRMVKGDNNNNAFYSVYHLGPMSPQLNARAAIFGRRLRSEFYSELRTRQQLGYAVFSGAGERLGAVSLATVIQGIERPAEYLSARSIEFINRFARELSESLTDEEFRTLVAGEIEDRSRRSPSMEHRYEELLQLVFEMHVTPDFKDEMLSALRELTLAQFKQFLNDTFVAQTVTRASVYYNGTGFPLPQPLPGEEVW